MKKEYISIGTLSYTDLRDDLCGNYCEVCGGETRNDIAMCDRCIEDAEISAIEGHLAYFHNLMDFEKEV